MWMVESILGVLDWWLCDKIKMLFTDDEHMKFMVKVIDHVGPQVIFILALKRSRVWELICYTTRWFISMEICEYGLSCYRYSTWSFIQASYF